jgi:hypothetical protein
VIWRIALSLLLLQAQPQLKGTIEGVVVHSASNEPIEGATVVLTNVPQTKPAISLTTDSRGRFAFTDVDPGSYKVGIAANGYVRMEYGQRVFPGASTTLHIASGQTMTNLVVRMIQTGNVSGRMRDATGQPLPGVPVQLVSYAYTEFGERVLRTIGVPQITDDHGEYRFFFVTPNRYYLLAGIGESGQSNRVGVNQIAQQFTRVFYPGVPDVGMATVLDVKPGQELGGIDMTVRPQSLYRVRGRVTDASTGKAPDNPSFRLRYFDVNGFGEMGAPAYQDGVFEFRGLPPGSFIARASVAGNRAGYLPVNVGNGDVEGVLLTIPAVTSIAGRWSVEGTNSRPRTEYEPSLRLRSTIGGSFADDVFAYGTLRPDGTLTVTNVIPGEYRLMIAGIPAGYYVRDARYGAASILGQTLKIGASELAADPKSLEIVLSPNAATVEGVVRNATRDVVAGATVVVVPDRAREYTDLYKMVTTDQNGRFTISSVAPGDYKLFAWEAIQTRGWFDPEVLKRDEPRSKLIHLTERARETVEASLIPAESR